MAWNDWGEWGDCHDKETQTRTCFDHEKGETNVGTQKRIRTCDGGNCVGSEDVMRDCILERCRKFLYLDQIPPFMLKILFMFMII